MWNADDAAAQMGLLATGDWGGQSTPPYYNDVEMANANAMAGLMLDPLVEAKPSFGLLVSLDSHRR